MKFLFKKTAVVLAVALLGACLASCGTEKAPESADNGKVIVKFDANLDNTGFTASMVTSVNDQTIDSGKTAVNKPLTLKDSDAVNPNNLGFRCWCTDKDGNNAWDFSTPVTKSMTLYAKWESKYVVTYHNLTSDVKSNVFPGEKAERKDSEVGWKKVLGWYTDAAFTKVYDFSSPVNSNLDLYVQTAEGIYIAPARFKNFDTNYGSVSGKDADDDTTIEIIGENENAYSKIHFARCQNVSYIYYRNINVWIADQTTNKRIGDKMTISYKNLGDSNVFRFYYVVKYMTGDNNDYSGGGGWKICVQIPIKSNMLETDDWDTVEVNLAKATVVSVTAEDGTISNVSEWGTAKVLCIPRWDACKADDPANSKSHVSSWYQNNDVLIKGIEFTAVTED